MGGIPRPRPCFLDSCDSFGERNGEKVWRSKDKTRLYTWDSLHGEIEMYNDRGIHLGVLEPVNGYAVKPAKKGRKIDV